jgi:hypothetical protein
VGADWVGADWVGAGWLDPGWLGWVRLGAGWLGAGWLGWVRLGAGWLGAGWLGAGWLDRAWLGWAWPDPSWLGRDRWVPCGLLACGGLTPTSHAVEATASSPAITTTPMIRARRSGRWLPGSQGSSGHGSSSASVPIWTSLNGPASSEKPAGGAVSGGAGLYGGAGPGRLAANAAGVASSASG